MRFSFGRGPQRFFFYGLWQSDRTGAPRSWRRQGSASVDAYAAAAGRWLVTRDGFDLLVYLSDYDYAAHAGGPAGAREAVRRVDASLGELAIAAGSSTRSSTATPSSCSPTTGERASTARCRCTLAIHPFRARSSPHPTAPRWCTACPAADSIRANWLPM